MPLLGGAYWGYAQSFPAQGAEGQDSVKTKTTPTDSAWAKVKPRTLIVDPYRVMMNYRFRTMREVDIARVVYRDELEKVDGFIQSLGQIGKPYKRYRWGGASEFYDNRHFHNLLTGAEDVYTVNPETEVLYHDTRTPYVNVQYGQGKQELASLEVTVSQNVSPLLNFTLNYHRRQSTGPYTDNTTDHYNVYLSAYGHSPDEKYVAFANIGTNSLKDNMNGGVAQVYDYDQSFFKRQQPVSLTDAQLTRKYKDFYFKHYYRLSNDTMDTPHRLTFFNSVMRDAQVQQFTDSLIGTSTFSFAYPIYPTADSTFFRELSEVRRWKYAEGIGYRYSGFSFEMNHRLEVNNERLNLVKGDRNFVMNRFTPTLKGELEYRPLRFSVRGEYDLRRISTNFFEPGYYASGDIFINLGKFQLNYKEKVPGEKLSKQDSVTVIVEHRPFSVFGSYLYNQQNPTFLQAFYPAGKYNSLLSDRNLANQVFAHQKVGLAVWGKDIKGQTRVQQGNLLSVAAFQSQTNRMILYDTTMTLTQLGAAQYVRWQGIEAKFRLHLGKFSIENQTILQQPTTNLPDSQASWYTNSQPPLYGKAGVYYENQDLKIAAVLRAGVECYYHFGYRGWLFDPASQQFYAQATYDMPGYPRIDLVFSTQIKRTYLYFRAVNVAEGFPIVGYYTTPFYPMLDRTIMFGVTWPFFD